MSVFGKNIVENVAGFDVIVHEMPGASTTTVMCLIRAGAWHEEIDGVAHFNEHMFFKGTGGLGSKEINRRLDWLGSSNAATGVDQTTAHISTLPGKAAEAFHLLCNLVGRPTLDPAELDTERGVILEEEKMRGRDPGTAFFEWCLGELVKDRRVHHKIVGTPESIGRISVEDLKAYRDRWFTTKNIAWLIVGAIPDGLRQEVAISLKDLRGAISADGESGELEGSTAMDLGTWDAPWRGSFEHQAGETSVAVWMPWYTLVDKVKMSYLPNQAVSVIGGGLSSLLWQRVREELGLAYQVGMFPFAVKEGNICMVADVAPENVGIVERTMKGVIDGVLWGGVDTELVEVVLGQFEFGLARQATLPMAVCHSQLSHWFELKDVIDFENFTPEGVLAGLERDVNKVVSGVKDIAGHMTGGCGVAVMNGEGA